MQGRTGSARQKALKGPDLTRAEAHAKREDKSSKKRRVRDEGPLIYGSLDLVEAQKAHMVGVAKTGKTQALHMIIQYPTGLLDGSDPAVQQKMLDHAVKFANEFHGGDAVFAARLDRDEKGRHTIDVFAMPRYDFKYKDGRVARKASVSRFSKANAKARYNRDDPRAQGSAMQDAWHEYLRDELQLSVEARTRKKALAADRVEPEVYGLEQDKARHAIAVKALKQEQKQHAKTVRAFELGLRAVDAGQVFYKPEADGLAMRKLEKPVIRPEHVQIWRDAVRPVYDVLKSYARRVASMMSREAKAAESEAQNVSDANKNRQDAAVISAAREQTGQQPITEIEAIRERPKQQQQTR